MNSSPAASLTTDFEVRKSEFDRFNIVKKQNTAYNKKRAFKMGEDCS
jgi:hypothetical protein